MAADLREQLQKTLSGLYVLERELGGGGMSRVFVATETSLGRKVVIKVLPPELSEGVSVERFKREIQLAAQLTHPHIVPVHAAGETDGVPYYTMPLVDGFSLRTRLVKSGPLPITETIGILRDVAKALSYAHERGVVHRDIKPDNVLITGGSAVVTDFGIAKAIAAARTGPTGGTLTQIGSALGTPAYMAPEQAAADPGTNYRADIYAFGVMAYEMLAGRPPFHGRSPQKLLAAQMSEAPQPITELRPDTPPVLAELVMRCLEKDADNRPQTATDLVKALESVTSGGGHPAMPAILLGGRPRLARALAMWASAFVVVAIVARAAIIAIGLPEWVFPGAVVVMALGLPVILATYFVHRGAHQALTSAALTPGGSDAMHSTLTRLAVKASPHVSWRRTTLGGVYALVAFVCLVAGYMILRASGIGPAGSLLAAGRLQERPMLIVDDFRSIGPDTTLGSVVSEAVRADLAQSTAITLAPTTLITSTLQSMQRPPNARLDLTVAREVALRAGAKAVVDGEIRPLGAGYIITLRLVGADSGQELTSFRASADASSDLIETIGKLSRSLRGKIGESLKSIQANAPLPRVTTSSLEALRLFAAANKANDVDGDFPRAIKLLNEALAIDATFASAYRKLAVALGNAAMPQEQVDAATHKAYVNRDRLTKSERAFVTSFYYRDVARDRPKAIAALEALLEDGDSSVANNLSLILMTRREFARAESLLAGQMRRQPHFALPYTNLAALQAAQGKLSQAQATLDLARARFPASSSVPRVASEILFQRDELDSLEHSLTDLAQHRNSFNRSFASRRHSEVAFLRGRLKDSQRHLAKGFAVDSARGRPVSSLLDTIHAAMLDLWFREQPERGVRRLDVALARTPIARLPLADRPYFPVAVLYARAGRADRARALLSEYERDVTDTVWKRDQLPKLHAVRGEIALAEKRPADADAEFRQADRRPDGPADWCAACLSLALGRAHDVAGELDSTVVSFERYLEVPKALGWQLLDIDATFRAATYKRLGELWEQKGEREKALGYYLKFVDLWKNADPELQPKVAEVRQRIARLKDTERR